MKKIISGRILQLFIPALLAVSFVIILYRDNANQVPVRDIIVSLFVATTTGLLFSLMSVMLLRNKEKAVVFASVTTLIFYSFGFISQISPDSTFLQIPKFQIPAIISLGALLGVFVFLNRTGVRFTGFVKFLSLTSLILFLVPLGQVLVSGYQRSRQIIHMSPAALPVISNAQKLPDIYFLMPEDYSAGKVLLKSFHFSNQPFEDFLTGNGFYVAKESTSNYPKSFLTVASALNFEYLDYLSARYPESGDQGAVSNLINNNNLLRLLKPLGYKYYQIGSWWFLTQRNPLADENYLLEDENLIGLDEFTYAFLKSTAVSPILGVISPQSIVTQSDEDKRRRILYQFQTLPKIAALPGPKFVFVHIIAPHDPYVFDKNCASIGHSQTDQVSEEQNYVNQVNCVNQFLETAIIQIQNLSGHEAVIVLQTDEGAPFLGKYVKPNDNWKDADDGLLREKFPIVSAYYLPGVTGTELYPSISPVNSFRIVLNHYFDTHLPLLPDRNYIFPDTEHLYSFIDVTNKVTPQSQ